MPVGTVIAAFFVFALGVILLLTLLDYRSKRPLRQDRKKMDELEALVDTIREHAYDHREIDSSPLATIIIDEIRTYESRQRKELR